MSKPRFTPLARIVVAVLLAAAAGRSWALDGTQILQQVDRNMEPSSYEEYRKLTNIEPDGSRKEYLLYIVKKGRDRIAALFLSHDLRGCR